MDTLLQKQKIASILNEVQKTSYEERCDSQPPEDTINRFLDQVNSLKRSLTDKSAKLNSITQTFGEITWFTDPDEESLMQLNTVIDISKSIYNTSIMSYARINKDFIRLRIGRDELSAFKLALDDFKEGYEELEFVFFERPKDKEFNDITDLLNSL